MLTFTLDDEAKVKAVTLSDALVFKRIEKTLEK